MYLAQKIMGILFCVLFFNGNEALFALESAFDESSPVVTGSHPGKSVFTGRESGFLYRGGVECTIETRAGTENARQISSEYDQQQSMESENFPVRMLEGEMKSSINMRMWKNAETWIEARIPWNTMLSMDYGSSSVTLRPSITEENSTGAEPASFADNGMNVFDNFYEPATGPSVYAQPVTESGLYPPWSELPSIMMRCSNAWIAWGPGQAASVLKTSGGVNLSRDFENVRIARALYEVTPEVGGAAGVILPAMHGANSFGLGAFRRENPDSIASRGRISWAIHRDGIQGTLYGGLSYDLVSLERQSVPRLWKPGRVLVLPARFSIVEGRTAYESNTFAFDLRTRISAGRLVKSGWSSVLKVNLTGKKARSILEVLGSTPDFRGVDAGFPDERFKASFSRIPVAGGGGVSMMTWLAIKTPGSPVMIDGRRYPSPIFWYECLESEMKFSFPFLFGMVPALEENPENTDVMQDFQNPDLPEMNMHEEPEMENETPHSDSTRTKNHAGHMFRIKPGLSMNLSTAASETDISEPGQTLFPQIADCSFPIQEDVRTKALFPLAMPVYLPEVNFKARVSLSAESLRETQVGDWKCSYGWRVAASIGLQTVWEKESGFSVPDEVLNTVPGLTDWNSATRISVKFLRTNPRVRFLYMDACSGTITAKVSAGSIPFAGNATIISKFRFSGSGGSKTRLELTFQIFTQGEKKESASTSSETDRNGDSFIGNLLPGLNVGIKMKYQCSLSLYIPVESPVLKQKK